MAIITTNTKLKIGYDQRNQRTAGTQTINNTVGGVALPFKSQFTGSITRVILSATLNSNVTGLEVGIMGSTAAGDLPSNTFLATPNVFSGSTAAFQNYTITLTNPVSVTKGAVYWLAFRGNGFTGNMSVHNSLSSDTSYNGTYRAAVKATTTWSRVVGQQGSAIAYGSSAKWYSNDMPVQPDTSLPSVTAAANQEYGIAFTLNANHPAILINRIGTMFGTNRSSTGNANMQLISKIYDAAGTLLYTFNAQDTDRFSTTAGFPFTYYTNATGSDIWLEPATKYYIMTGFTGTFTNAPSVVYYNLDVTAPETNGAYTACYANRSSAGVITETTTAFLPFWLDINAIRFNDSAGGGGGYVDASLMFSGGFNG